MNIDKNKLIIAAAIYDSIRNYKTESDYGAGFRDGFCEGFIRASEVFEIDWKAFSETQNKK